MVKILLTGYGPFGQVTTNPSWLAAKLLSESWDSADELMVKEVPVCYKYVTEHIPQILKEYNPDVILHVGAGNPVFTNEIHLETCAHSTGYIRLDVEKCCGPTTGPDICLTTSLNIEELVLDCSKCSKKGNVLDYKMSIDAGRYLCEFIFFTSLNYCKEHDKSLSVIFVHVPPITETCSLEVLRDGLKNVVLHCADQVRKVGEN